jgi:hypothetical protein
VEPDAGVVGQGDQGEGRVETLVGEAGEQLGVQVGAEAAAAGVAVQVDRRLHGEVVRRTVAELRRVGVAQHDAVLLGDHERVGGLQLVPPRLDRSHLGLERRVAVQRLVGVDLRDRLEVRLDGVPDVVGHGPNNPIRSPGPCCRLAA